MYTYNFQHFLLMEKNSRFYLLISFSMTYDWSRIWLGEGTKIVGHRDFPNVARDCPCFDCQSEYATLN